MRRGSRGVQVSVMASPNKRRDARAPANIPVVLFKGRTELRLTTSDVSYRGIFVETASAPSIRSLVKLRVEIPTGGFDAHAMVVHVAEAGRVGMGLQFWALSGTERKVWEEFVRGILAARAPVKVTAPNVPFVGSPDAPSSGIRSVAGVAAAAPSTPAPPAVVGQRGTRR